MTPLVVVTGRHRPHEVMFLVLSGLAGALYVAGVRPPTSLAQLLPLWMLWTWYVLLLASGTVGLVSIALGDPYRALVLERAAMLGQAAAPTVYGIGLAAIGQSTALFAGAFCAAWAAASVWRAWQVHQTIRFLRQGAAS